MIGTRSLGGRSQLWKIVRGDEIKKNLADVLSGYRAEWLGAEVFRLFTQPSYFPQLTTAHPCFLVGGRGTGKTTTLRCLSYQGQEELRRNEVVVDDPQTLPFVGLYYRVNTNRVRAFGGSELDERMWTRLFGHYVNLEFSELVLRFLLWHAHKDATAEQISAKRLSKFAESLNLQEHGDLNQILAGVERSRIRFEATINNVAEARIPALSLQGAPIDELLMEVKNLSHFYDTSFFFLLDEYENFDDSQKRAINTLIKHCGEYYSFKVGVREFGDSQRATLDDREQLRHPADYKRIDIRVELQGRFAEFAAAVCNQRIVSVFRSGHDIRQFLPELSPEEEAVMLGVSEFVSPWIEEIKRDPSIKEEEINWLESVNCLEMYTLVLRARVEGITAIEKLRKSMSNRRSWKAQYENYKYAYLFTIKKRKSGIRKHYAGWGVYCQLASTNIRFMLELVDQAFSIHVETAPDPYRPISHDVQTDAAQKAGQKNLTELEGLSLSGAKLTRFLLSLGRVFQVMAEDPVGHTPEVNQFHLSNDISNRVDREYAISLLREGITNLALLHFRGSKLQDPTDIRQFDYTIHPMFAPVFGFSHRKKRKIMLSDSEFKELVDRPTDAISKLLQKQRRVALDELPNQIKLFSDHYE